MDGEMEKGMGRWMDRWVDGIAICIYALHVVIICLLHDCSTIELKVWVGALE
jgi:hypothetical protein